MDTRRLSLDSYLHKLASVAWLIFLELGTILKETFPLASRWKEKQTNQENLTMRALVVTNKYTRDPLKNNGEFFQPIRRETTNRPTNQGSKIGCPPEKTINVVEARCGKTCATRRKFGIDSNLLKMTLTKRAWRFSTDLSATLIPLISLISSPGCSVPKIKKQTSLFHLCWDGLALLQTCPCKQWAGLTH